MTAEFQDWNSIGTQCSEFMNKKQTAEYSVAYLDQCFSKLSCVRIQYSHFVKISNLWQNNTEEN